MRVRSCWLAVLLLLTIPLVSACADPPDERLVQAWEAAELEDFEAFVLFFTAPSRDLLRGLAQTAKRTRGDLEYISPVWEVLPKGEVTETRIRGNLALVEVKAKRRRGVVRMLKERGLWMIDATTLPELWLPLREAGRE